MCVGAVVEWFKALDWRGESRGSIPGTTLMPLIKAFYLHCSFIVGLHQINENAIGIIDTNVCTCLFKKRKKKEGERQTDRDRLLQETMIALEILISSDVQRAGAGLQGGQGGECPSYDFLK